MKPHLALPVSAFEQFIPGDPDFPSFVSGSGEIAARRFMIARRVRVGCVLLVQSSVCIACVFRTNLDGTVHEVSLRWSHDTSLNSTAIAFVRHTLLAHAKHGSLAGFGCENEACVAAHVLRSMRATRAMCDAPVAAPAHAASSCSAARAAAWARRHEHIWWHEQRDSLLEWEDLADAEAELACAIAAWRAERGGLRLPPACADDPVTCVLGPLRAAADARRAAWATIAGVAADGAEHALHVLVTRGGFPAPRDAQESRSGRPPCVYVDERDVAGCVPPLLFLIGAQKSGTSSLYIATLHHVGGCRHARHDSTNVNESDKEPHFLDAPAGDAFFTERLASSESARALARDAPFVAYLARFHRCESGGRACESDGAPCVGVDATPKYLRHPLAPIRLRALYDPLGLSRRATFAILLREARGAPSAALSACP